jgi:hypothetical protein
VSILVVPARAVPAGPLAELHLRDVRDSVLQRWDGIKGRHRHWRGAGSCHQHAHREAVGCAGHRLRCAILPVRVLPAKVSRVCLADHSCMRLVEAHAVSLAGRVPTASRTLLARRPRAASRASSTSPRRLPRPTLSRTTLAPAAATSSRSRPARRGRRQTCWDSFR